MTPSPQQQAVYDKVSEGKHSIVVEAVAGAGKTTLLLGATKHMKGSIILGVYNKMIELEIAAKLGQSSPVQVTTMHAAGMRALSTSLRGFQVESNKMRDLFDQELGSNLKYSSLKTPILALCSFAKNQAVGVENEMGDFEIWQGIIDHFGVDCIGQENNCIMGAIRLLKFSNDVAQHIIDFDDMVYLPLLMEIRLPKFDWVLIDEAQDTNRSRRLLALGMMKNGGKLVAVGDRHQAIYGFTGADSNALDLIAEATDAIRMPLTVTYRCPQAVVAVAREYVNHIQAHPSAPAGDVEFVHENKVMDMVRPGDAILCRFNAPLVRLCYLLISKGRAAKVEGRDIGEGLKKLALRLKAPTFDEMFDKVKFYQDKEVANWMLKKREQQAQAVIDTCETLVIIMNRCLGQVGRQPADLVGFEIDRIFGDDVNKQPVVLLSSIHKSKGREWPRVFWLQTGKATWIKQEWEKEQENNLNYVAPTRAMAYLAIVQQVKKSK